MMFFLFLFKFTII